MRFARTDTHQMAKYAAKKRGRSTATSVYTYERSDSPRNMIAADVAHRGGSAAQTKDRARSEGRAAAAWSASPVQTGDILSAHAYTTKRPGVLDPYHRDAVAASTRTSHPRAAKSSACRNRAHRCVIEKAQHHKSPILILCASLTAMLCAFAFLAVEGGFFPKWYFYAWTSQTTNSLIRVDTPLKFLSLSVYTFSASLLFESCYQLVSAWSLALKNPDIARSSMAGDDITIHLTRQLYMLLTATNTALNIVFAVTNVWLLLSATAARSLVVALTTKHFLNIKMP